MRTVASSQPFWVRMALWGVPDRCNAVIFYWVCLVFAVAFPLYMAETRQHLPPWWLWSGCLGFLALAYLAAVNIGRAIRWRDEHDAWAARQEPHTPQMLR